MSDDLDDLVEAFDDCSPGSTVHERRVRIKPRDHPACSTKDTPVYLPENFRDLAEEAQAALFRRFMCPTSKPPYKTTPLTVCSSRLPENTKLAFAFDIAGDAVAPGLDTTPSYTLLDSFLSMKFDL